MWEVPWLGSSRAGTQTRSVFRALLHLSCLPCWSCSWWTHSVCQGGSSMPPEFCSFPGPVQAASFQTKGFWSGRVRWGQKGGLDFHSPLQTFLIPTCKGTVAAPPPPGWIRRDHMCKTLGIPCLRCWGPRSTLGR